MTQVIRKVDIIYGIDPSFERAVQKLNTGIDEILAIDEAAYNITEIQVVPHDSDFILMQQWSYFEDISANSV